MTDAGSNLFVISSKIFNFRCFFKDHNVDGQRVMLQLDKREPQKTEIVRLVERKEDGKCKKVDNLIHC